MWFRNVPDELLTSLMNQLPSLHQSSQCFRLTTFDLNPTAAADGMLDRFSGTLSRSEYRPTLMIADSSGRVRLIVGNCSDGRPARGSWCGIKRIDGWCFTAGASSAPGSSGTSVVVDGPGVDAGVGPALLRTDSCGAAVSARFLVMLSGDAGGESLGEGCGRASVSVCLREGGCGRAVGAWEEAAREGEAGGVCVEARGRVFDGWASRASSEAPLACKCRFLRKLKPRRPDGRGEGEDGERAVAATVGAAGAGAVNITRAVAKEGEDQPGRPRTLGGCVNRVSTTFDRQRSTDSLFTRPYALQYLYQGAEGHGGGAARDCKYKEW